MNNLYIYKYIYTNVIFFFFQAQYSYAVIQILMSHLDEKSGMNVFGKGRKRPKIDAKVRTGIVNVLANIVSIAAGESIGRNLFKLSKHADFKLF